MFICFSESDFSQQKLPAWQPILTAGTVLPAFFVIGIAFVAIGVGLLHFSNQVLEFGTDYTHCKAFPNDNDAKCLEVIQENKTCQCKVGIKVESEMVSTITEAKLILDKKIFWMSKFFSPYEKRNFYYYIKL